LGLKAEDLAHEGWLEAFEKIGHFQGHTEEELRLWVLGIIKNKIRSLRRSEARKLKSFESISHWKERDTLRMEGAPGKDLAVEVLLERKEIDQVVHAAISKACSELEAGLIELVCVEGVPIARVAVTLKVSASRLQKCLSRGLEKVFNTLKSQEDFKEFGSWPFQSS
jgi:RNA polymerase sigma factor (sigma-70 family)